MCDRPFESTGPVETLTNPEKDNRWTVLATTVDAEVGADANILQAYEDQNTTVEPGFRWIENPAMIRESAWNTLNVRPHRFYPLWCSAIPRYWQTPCTESITRGVSQQNRRVFRSPGRVCSAALRTLQISSLNLGSTTSSLGISGPEKIPLTPLKLLTKPIVNGRSRLEALSK